MDANTFAGVLSLVMILAFLVVALVFERNAKRRAREEAERMPTEKDFEKKVRIVELLNGQFVVERYNEVTLEWEMPYVIGKTHFSSVHEAEKLKADLIKEMVERAGYRVKRVVQ